MLHQLVTGLIVLQETQLTDPNVDVELETMRLELP